MMYLYYLVALVAIIATIKVVTNDNPVHALLNMIVSLLSIAGLFFMMGAPFAGALEVLVYAGAILVLFVFVVMMLNLGRETVAQEKKWLTSKGLATPFMLASVLLLTMLFSLGQEPVTGLTFGNQMIDAKQVGINLFTNYLLLVEFASLLLLSALVAAYHLAKRTPELEDLSENQTNKEEGIK